MGRGGNQPNRALRFEVKLGGERGVDHVELAPSVDHEIERARLVDFDGNNEQYPGDNPRFEAREITGTTRFCVTGNGWEGKCEKETERAAGGWEFHGRPPLAGRESKATLTAISGYLNGLGVESMSMKYGKDVDRHNCP
jgi:hypothetical protein